MTFRDLSQMGLANLWRTKLRSILTILGVIIGIAALTSMISFGVGMQKNITETFEKNDLFTSLNITAKKIDLSEISEGDFEDIADSMKDTGVVLNDSLVEILKKIPNVTVVNPEINIPVNVKYRDHDKSMSVRSIPMEMAQYTPFKNLKYGNYFSHDSALEALIPVNVLKKLKLKVKNIDSVSYDTTKKITIIPPDSIINDYLEVKAKMMDVSGIINNPFMAIMGGMQQRIPFKDSIIKFKIVGIIKEPSQFGDNRFLSGIFVPTKTINRIPRLGFRNIWDILDDKQSAHQYGSIYVRAKDVKSLGQVKKELKDMGLNVFSFSDELQEIKRVFLIMDSMLGAIGLIALVVAALGIINTMLMSILERTREIGIMKSIGGSEGEIKTIFFVEASFIGFIGAIIGLGLGWLVTRVANYIMNAKLIPEDLPSVDMFSFPWWLVLGATAFSILLSLAAGLYPAIRAARIDPVKALRHD